MRPAARSSIAVSSPSSGMSSRVEERADVEIAGGEQLDGLFDAAGVVLERAGDDELVQQDAVGVEGRGLDAGADQHEGAAPAELAQGGVHGDRLARALDDGVERVVDDAVGLDDGDDLERVGFDDGGAEALGELLALGPGLADDDVGDATGAEADDGQRRRSDRPR